MPLMLCHDRRLYPALRSSTGLLMYLLFCLAGCAALDTSTGPVLLDNIEIFKPIPIPTDFDPVKAEMTLARIPGDPPAPQGPSTIPNIELPKQARQHMEEAEHLFAQELFNETIVELEKALRYETGHYPAFRLIALARAMSGNDTSARFYAQRALALKPNDLTCHFLLAWLAERDQNTEEALRGYRLALKCPDDDPVYRVLTHYYLGGLLEREGYYTAAIAQLQAFDDGVETLGEKVKNNPDLATIARVHRVSTLIRLARAQDILGQYTEAAKGLERAVERMPGDISLRIGLIRRLVLADRLDEATDQADRFLQDSNGSVAAVKLLLAVYYHIGHPRDGLRQVQQVLAARPDDVQLALIYADALAAAHEYDQAIAELESWAERFPEEETFRWRLAEAYRIRGQWSPWLNIVIKALATKPADDASIEQALGRLTREQSEQIVEHAVTATDLRDEPSMSAALDYVLGSLCDRLDLVDQSRAFFERARQARSDYLPAVLGEARLLINRCRWAEAIATLKTAEKTLGQPDHRLHLLLGQSHEGLDQVESAVAGYEKAIQLNPLDTRPMFLLGRLCERVGLIFKARQYYQATITIEPDHLPAREALAQSYMNQLQQFLRPEERNEIQKRLLGEIKELEVRGAQSPPTQRITALFRYLFLPADEDDRRGPYLETLTRLAYDFPDDQRTHELLATTLFAFREYTTAAVHVEEMLKRDPYSSTGNELQSLLLIRALRFDEAVERLRTILEWYPNRTAWIQTLSNLYLLDRRYDEAVALWDHLLSLPGPEERRMFFRGQLLRVLQLAKRYEEARDLIGGWLDQAVPTQRNWYRLRLCLLDLTTKDYSRCIESCRQWLLDEPEDPDLRNWLLLALRQAGHYDEATLLALSWLSAQPDDPQVIDWLVNVLSAARRHDEAVELLVNQLAGSVQIEDQLMVLDKLVNTYVVASRYPEAIAAARDMIARDRRAYDQKIELYEKLGGIFTRAGRFEEAIGHYQIMLRQAQSDQEKAESLRRIAFTYQRKGNLERALVRLREAYELDPSDIGINNDLGYTLAEMGRDLDDAAQMTRLAVGEDYMQPAYLDSLGWVMYKKGRPAEARLWLERATALENGEDPIILDHLGDVYWRLGDREQAMATWQHALQTQSEQQDDMYTEPNEEVMAAIQTKLERAQQGGTPQVATMPANGD
ncbi:MAG: tetratricopeptide repeat protein [Phycisphaerales bacterium]|nr:tetratricopeptide repeat protein [Phycisphaerales bacterium]